MLVLKHEISSLIMVWTLVICQWIGREDMLNKSALNTTSWEGEKIVMLVSNACNMFWIKNMQNVLNQAWRYISVNNWGLVCN